MNTTPAGAPNGAPTPGGYQWRRRKPRLDDLSKPELIVLVRHLELLVQHLEEALYDKRISDFVLGDDRLRAAEVQRQAAVHLRTLPPDPHSAQHRVEVLRNP